MSKIGAHVSIAKGIDLAPSRAAELGCEFFQFFSQSPRGGNAKKLDEEMVKSFLAECHKYNFESWKSSVIHSAYFINLASKNNRIFYGSVSSLKKELSIANKLKVPFVVTHIGSAKDFEGEDKRKQAYLQVEKGLEKILADYQGKAQLLLEIAAGSGDILGDSIDEIAHFTAKFDQLGFCVDTCHSFVAGFDLRSKSQVKDFFAEIDHKVGAKKLKLLHLNDSLTDFDSHVDRHDHLGKGKIGTTGISAVIEIAQQRALPMIIETKPEGVVADIEFAKKIRDSF